MSAVTRARRVDPGDSAEKKDQRWNATTRTDREVSWLVHLVLIHLDSATKMARWLHDSVKSSEDPWPPRRIIYLPETRLEPLRQVSMVNQFYTATHDNEIEGYPERGTRGCSRTHEFEGPESSSSLVARRPLSIFQTR